VSIAADFNDSVLRIVALADRTSRAGRPNPTGLDAGQSDFTVEASQGPGFNLIRLDPSDTPNLPSGPHDWEGR